MFHLANIFFVGVVVAAFSIPFVFRLVPRNPLFGFRVPATMRDAEVWYVMNRRVGLQMIVFGTALAAAAALSTQLGFDTAAARGILTAVMFGGLGTITVRGWIAANRLLAGKQSHRTT